MGENILLGPGTGTFTDHTLEIIIMLLVAFLLGLWFGWGLWSRYKKEADRLRLDNESLNASTQALRAELDELRKRFEAVDAERAEGVMNLRSLTDDHRSLSERLTLLSQQLEQAERLNRQYETEIALTKGESPAPPTTVAFELETPADLEAEAGLAAETTAPKMPDIAVELAENQAPALELEIEMTAPHSTIVDASAAEADTDIPALERFAAPPIDDDHFSDASFEALTRSVEAPTPEVQTIVLDAPETPDFVITPLRQDDLKIIEGIGPKIEGLLFEAGIHTYSELAAAPVTRLKEILVQAGSRYAMHDPGTWSAQALLAANGEWDNLQAYQDFLNAGKRPEK